jgi:hypothetical protein
MLEEIVLLKSNIVCTTASSAFKCGSASKAFLNPEPIFLRSNAAGPTTATFARSYSAISQFLLLMGRASNLK